MMSVFEVTTRISPFGVEFGVRSIRAFRRRPADV